MALSLLEMKDQQLSTPSQESQLLQPGNRPSKSSSVQLDSVSKSHHSKDVLDRRKNTHSVQTGPWGKESSPIRETELDRTAHLDRNKQTPGTCQTVSVSGRASFREQDTIGESNQRMGEGDVNQSEKSKRSKNRRQRRKGAGKQLVGLPGSPSAPPPVLLWFRRDLRLCDNPALMGSLEVGAPVIPVFIWSPEEEEGPGITVAVGGACKSNQISGYRNP